MYSDQLEELRSALETETQNARLLLETAEAFAEGHFVYKSGLHGPGYINKEKFATLGVEGLDTLLMCAAANAVLNSKSDIIPGSTIVVIGLAYGAIGYAHPFAKALSHFSEKSLNLKFVPGRTQLDSKGNHFFPDKLVDNYSDADVFVIIEDIVNNGTTICEVNKAVLKSFALPVSVAISIANRGGQTAESLGIKEYYPLFDINMEQIDPRTTEGIQKINTLGEINTALGKGKAWVEKFGQPPYSATSDFSVYPFAD